MSVLICTQWLFFHLWKKHPVTNVSCQGVSLPHTLFYKWSQPYLWYFTNEGIIMRKNKDTIRDYDILSNFNSEEQKIAVIIRPQSKLYNSVQEITFQYHDLQSLQKIINKVDYKYNSSSILIQKISPPMNNRNISIRVQWTRILCVLTKYINKNNYNRNSIPIVNRLVTFQGPSTQVIQEEFISPIISRDIQNLCLNIASHTSKVSNGCIQIKKLVLYFKIDENNMFQLLFCQDILIQQKGYKVEKGIKYLGFNQIKMKLKKIDQSKYIKNKCLYQERNLQSEEGIRQLELLSRKNCANCELQTINKYQIQFEHIIQSYLHNNLQNTVISQEFNNLRKQFLNIKPSSYPPNENFSSIQQQVKWLCRQLDLEQNYKIFKDMEKIPLLIIKLCGRMDKQKYQRLKKKKQWLKLKTLVCGNCYTNLTQYLIISNQQKNYINAKKQYEDKIYRKRKHEIFEKSNSRHQQIIKKINSSSLRILNRHPPNKGFLIHNNFQKQQKIIINPIKDKENHISLVKHKKYNPSKVYYNKKFNNNSCETESISTLNTFSVALATIQKIRENSHFLENQSQVIDV